MSQASFSDAAAHPTLDWPRPPSRVMATAPQAGNRNDARGRPAIEEPAESLASGSRAPSRLRGRSPAGQERQQAMHSQAPSTPLTVEALGEVIQNLSGKNGLISKSELLDALQAKSTPKGSSSFYSVPKGNKLSQQPATLFSNSFPTYGANDRSPSAVRRQMNDAFTAAVERPASAAGRGGRSFSVPSLERIGGPLPTAQYKPHATYIGSEEYNRPGAAVRGLNAPATFQTGFGLDPLSPFNAGSLAQHLANRASSPARLEHWRPGPRPAPSCLNFSRPHRGFRPTHCW